MSRTSMPSQAIRWVWLGILALAIGSRLLGLAATPLSPGESGAALSAWDTVSTGVWPATADSPLLLTGQTLLFALLGPSEVAARLLPALTGVLLVGLPLLWRKDLGNLGALVAACLLLASPLSLFTARRADGAALAVLGGALVVTVILQALADADADTREHETLLALGLTLGLTGGAPFYDMAIAGCVACWVIRRAAPRGKIALRWKRAALIGIGLSLLVSVAFGLHWSGWAGIADGAAAWWAEWLSPAERSTSPLGMLLLYEPLLLISAATGLALLVNRHTADRHLLPRAFALWAVVAALLVAVRPGSAPEALSAIIVPLALLGGFAADRLLSHLPPESLRWMGLHVLTSALFWAPGLLALTQHASNYAFNDQIAIIILGIVVLVALQVMLLLIFMMQLPSKYLWRSALLGIGVIFLFLQLSFGAGLAFVRSDSATEPAIQVAGSRDLHHLSQAAQEIAVTRHERADSLDIVLIDQNEELTDLIRWALRDFDALRLATSWPTGGAALVISPGTEAVLTPDTSEAWQGLRFVAMTRAAAPAPGCRQLVPLDCRDAVSWYLYRHSPVLPTATYAILWQAATQTD
ncbi:MAG: hypothetical protein MUQ30_11805 [Anaerolineae bacterium]|nr:hypothetical protein [Anaerolineae bacterium]